MKQIKLSLEKDMKIGVLTSQCSLEQEDYKKSDNLFINAVFKAGLSVI